MKDLKSLKQMFLDSGCVKLYVKELSENDNSKNQVYLGMSFKALNLIPVESIIPSDGSKNPIFKGKLKFGWMDQFGRIFEAPNAQLILYPQYPEVRFSGFLKGCLSAPSELMSQRLVGRLLFLGVTQTASVVGYVCGRTNPIAREFFAKNTEDPTGVFVELSLPKIPDERKSRSLLISELKRIHELGWIDSKQLATTGIITDCRAPQCGGFTLEAELGIAKNSNAEPDFHGWEIKQYAVRDLKKVNSGAAITLMTPEPTGGIYKEQGPEVFIRRFGYADKLGRVDRLNFGGIHLAGTKHATTGLTMSLIGYDFGKQKIMDPKGAIALLTDKGVVAASWDFASLMRHWIRKHSRAVYVPSNKRENPRRQYCYGGTVQMAEGTEFLTFLKALGTSAIYYDPGIKMEGASTSHPQVKRRSQFRINSKKINRLYEKVDIVTL